MFPLSKETKDKLNALPLESRKKVIYQAQQLLAVSVPGEF